MQHKKVSVSLIVLLIAGLFFTLLGCGGSEPLGEVTWEYEQRVPEPLVKIVEAEEAILGDLATHGIEIKIPAGAFDDLTEVALVSPAKDIVVDTSLFEPVGSLYTLEIRGEQKRTNKPLLISIKVDSDELAKAEETEGYRGLHYHEEAGWSYIQPTYVDAENSVVQFETYHNFLFSSGRLTEEERIETFADQISKTQWAQTQIETDIEELTHEIVQEMIIGGFNENNPDIIRHIANEVGKVIIDDVTIAGKLIRNINAGDYQTLGVNIAKKAGEQISKSIKSGRLKTTVKHAGVFSQAAGAIYEGNYQAAAEHIAVFVRDNSKIAQAGKLAIDSVGMKINNWKNDEIEKAYQIYVNGAESSLPWGYHVEAGDFDGLWVQMRGVAHKVQSDALKRFSNLTGIPVDEIPKERADQIREQARRDLLTQFEARKEQEAEIEKFRENNHYVIERMQDWGLLRYGSVWYPTGTSIEQMLNRLYNQIDLVLHETDRTSLVYRSGDLHDQSRGSEYIGQMRDDELMLEQVLELVHIRYTEGHDKYIEKLVEWGLIEPIPEGLSAFVPMFTPEEIIQTMDHGELTQHFSPVNVPIRHELAKLSPIEIPLDGRINISLSGNSWYDEVKTESAIIDYYVVSTSGYQIDHLNINIQLEDNRLVESSDGSEKLLLMKGEGTYSYQGSSYGSFVSSDQDSPSAIDESVAFEVSQSGIVRVRVTYERKKEGEIVTDEDRADMLRAVSLQWFFDGDTVVHSGDPTKMARAMPGPVLSDGTSLGWSVPFKLP